MGLESEQKQSFPYGTSYLCDSPFISPEKAKEAVGVGWKSDRTLVRTEDPSPDTDLIKFRIRFYNLSLVSG